MAVSEFPKYGIEPGLLLVQSGHVLTHTGLVLVQVKVSSGSFLVQTGHVLDQAPDLFFTNP